MKIEAEVRALQDLMRRDPGLDGDAQRLEQLVWLMLLRVATGSDSPLDTSAIPRDLLWSEWTLRLPVDDDLVATYVDHAVLANLRELRTGLGGQLAQLLGSVRNRMENGALLRGLISRVDGWVFSTSADVHRLGALYERLISIIGSAGNAGEFYTPRPLTHLMAELVSLRPGDAVADPASGTAGMLVSALDVAERQRVPITVSGVEKKPLPYILGATNLLVHGIRELNAITRGNMLTARWDEVKPEFDVVLTNPPFGASEEPGIDATTPTGLRSQETLDLFMARIPRLLRPGGRAAVIVPDGFLFGAGAKAALRAELVDNLHLRLLLRLAPGVFSPYTSIASNVLLFEKSNPADGLWIYEVEPPKGVKAFSRRNALTSESFDAFRAWWHTPGTSAASRWVSTDELRGHGYNLDLHVGRAQHEVHEVATIEAELQASESAAANAFKQLSAEVLKDIVPNFAAETIALLGAVESNVDIKSAAPALRRSLTMSAALGWFSSLPASDAVPVPQPKTARVNARARRLNLDLKCARLSPAARTWSWAPLAHLGTLVGGGTPDTRLDDVFSDDEGVPWLTPADLRGSSAKYVDRGRRYLTDKGVTASAAKVLPVGSILFSTRAPIGYVSINATPLATNQGFRSLVPGPLVHADYYYYLLLAMAPLIDSAASGTTFKEVAGSQLASLEVPVPPLVHQITIAKKLDAVHSALTKWQQESIAADAARTKLVEELFHLADVTSTVA